MFVFLDVLTAADHQNKLYFSLCLHLFRGAKRKNSQKVFKATLEGDGEEKKNRLIGVFCYSSSQPWATKIWDLSPIMYQLICCLMVEVGLECHFLHLNYLNQLKWTVLVTCSHDMPGSA